MYKETLFGLINGVSVYLFKLENTKGTEVKITNYGARIVAILTHDQFGDKGDIILGYDTLADYQNDKHYLGAVVGPCPGRLSENKFTLEGVEYLLEKNTPSGHLHGGSKGFSFAIWEVLEYSDNRLTLRHQHRHLDSGYPGNINVELTYALDNQNVLSMKSKVFSDRRAIFNITYHPYFNLKGQGDILDNTLTIHGEKVVDMGIDWSPSGHLLSVEDTPFDFRTAKKIGKDIESSHQMIKLTSGYDQAWIVGEKGNMKTVASISEPSSGRVLNLRSDMPALVFYTGNFLHGIRGKQNTEYKKHTGFCMEPQQYPDAANQKNFPSVIIEPNRIYESETQYCFSLEKKFRCF
ncbi:aldose 1-epimerase [Elysia marginata]|uniref:Aldose 1-epimerase n=1 Tax=Elysia marginata TaxID=1093978 RepID=A0AAV4JAF1_9GAST|nr:aldose 1-epimerase [Elysia marginata]